MRYVIKREDLQARRAKERVLLEELHQVGFPVDYFTINRKGPWKGSLSFASIKQEFKKRGIESFMIRGLDSKVANLKFLLEYMRIFGHNVPLTKARINENNSIEPLVSLIQTMDIHKA
jgi:hypothetical protein